VNSLLKTMRLQMQLRIFLHNAEIGKKEGKKAGMVIPLANLVTTIRPTSQQKLLPKLLLT